MTRPLGAAAERYTDKTRAFVRFLHYIVSQGASFRSGAYYHRQPHNHQDKVGQDFGDPSSETRHSIPMFGVSSVTTGRSTILGRRKGESIGKRNMCDRTANDAR